MTSAPIRPLLFAVLAAALLSGCTVGPDYKRPQAAVQDAWIEPGDSAAVDARWWDSFGDPVLSDLVNRALAGNLDLAEARTRIAEARAGREATAGGALPQVQAKSSYNTNELSKNGQLPIGALPGFARDFPLYDLGFDASWEIDLWGHARRQIEAARAREDAALWGRRDIALGIAAETARAYVDLRSAQAQAGLAAADLQANDALLRLTRQRSEAGETNTIDLSQTAAARESSARALEQARASVSAAGYRIAVLLGIAPEALPAGLMTDARPVPAPPVTIARGIRSDLLERRPDIRRAERDLAAATADIGAAKADLFPRISLVGSIGQQARDPGDLGSSASTRFSAGPSLSWPIFAGGRIRAQVRAADARAEATTVRYRKAIVGALSDSEGAANRQARTAAALAAATRSADAERQSFRLVESRVRAGEDDDLALARARLRLTQAERAELSARADCSAAAIALYKSLGGGWDAAEAK